jgi:DNA polymerase
MTNQQKLNLIAEKIKACQKCKELAENRLLTVPGSGNPNAKIVFCGEAPGKTESEQGVPFCGRAGQLLDKIILSCNLKREDVFICNVLKCRPPNNRPPTLEESANCRPFFDLQLETIAPDYIVCLGATATKHLLQTEISITAMRGKWHYYNLKSKKVKVLSTYHPAYLLRNPSAKEEVWKDLQLLIEDINNFQ